VTAAAVAQTVGARTQRKNYRRGRRRAWMLPRGISRDDDVQPSYRSMDCPGLCCCGFDFVTITVCIPICISVALLSPWQRAVRVGTIHNATLTVSAIIRLKMTEHLEQACGAVGSGDPSCSDVAPLVVREQNRSLAEWNRWCVKSSTTNANKNTKIYTIYLWHRSNPQQDASTVGASNKPRSGALEARHYASNCLK
jgi:hypothetical protein